MGVHILDKETSITIKGENGRYIKIHSYTTSHETKPKDQQILLSGRDFEVLIDGVTVHQMISHVMGETPISIKKAMRDHLNYLIEREERI